MRTAIVRNDQGNISIKRYDDYKTNKEFADELRMNGFKVLKVWAKNISNEQADEWIFINRK